MRLNRESSERLGITMIEVLLVISALALASTIVWPALLKGREAMRRGHCLNNLKQLGMALESYHETQGFYPPAGVWKVPENFIREIRTPEAIAELSDHKALNDVIEEGLYNQSWAVFLLSHMGEDELAGEFDLSVLLSDPRNEKARTTEFAAMKCPSDTYNHSQNHYAKPYLDATFARGNYALNAGTYRIDWKYPGRESNPCPNCYQYTFDSVKNTFQFWGDGAGGINRGFRKKDFVNGLSMMVAVDEIREGLLPVDSRGAWALGEIGSSVTSSHGVHGDARVPNSPFPRSDDTEGCDKLHELMSREAINQAGMTCCWYCSSNLQAGARSMHPGGVNILMMDGSAGFVPDDVDANVWHAMHSRDVRGEFTLPFSTSGASDTPEEPAVFTVRSGKVIDKTVGPKIVNSIEMKFTLVPAGEFIMGLPDEGAEGNYFTEGFAEEVPFHPVRITSPFYLGTFEVTQSQYEKVMGENPSWHAPNGGGRGELTTGDTTDFPVEKVSWYDADEFCHRLSSLPAEQAAGRLYRLPTEAEWEYSCRSGKTTPYHQINYHDPIPEESLNSGDNFRRPRSMVLPVTSVGSYKPIEFGLYDMRGNVFEWTADWFSRDYYRNSPRDDPQGPSNGFIRVVRGSDWIYIHHGCKAEFHPVAPILTSRFIGFRVVCEFTSQ